MLQFGGHHLAINLTMAGSQATMAPSLPAAQPATFTFEGPHRAPARRRKRQGFALINALDDKQQSQAILNYRVADLVLGPAQDGKTIQPEGIRASALTAAQQTMLLGHRPRVVRHHRPTRSRTPRMTELKSHLNDTYFAWSGPTTNGSAAYFRIQGPTLVIEYAPQKQRRSHPHDLSRSDERLRSEDCEASPLTEPGRLRLAITASPCPASGGALRRPLTAIVASALLVCATGDLSAHRRDELLQAARIGIAGNRVELELSVTPGIDVADA